MSDTLAINNATTPAASGAATDPGADATSPLGQLVTQALHATTPLEKGRALQAIDQLTGNRSVSDAIVRGDHSVSDLTHLSQSHAVTQPTGAVCRAAPVQAQPAKPAEHTSFWGTLGGYVSDAAHAVGEFDRNNGSILTRGLGVVQAVGGGVEAVGGVVGGVLTSETGVGALAGGAVALNGADNFVAGIRTAISGHATLTGGQQLAGAGVKALGGNTTAVAVAETVAGVGPGGVKSIATGAGRIAEATSRVSGVVRTAKISEEIAPLAAPATGTVEHAAGVLPQVAADAHGVAPSSASLTAPVTAPVAGRSINYGPLDALGRPTGVTARITSDMIGTGTKANPSIIPPGWSGNGVLNNEARGHLLGAQLGGSGDVAENLVTLQQNPANSPVMRGFENRVRSAVEGGQVVDYASTPIYNGGSLTPRGITLTGSGSGGFDLNVTILNPLGLPR